MGNKKMKDKWIHRIVVLICIWLVAGLSVAAEEPEERPRGPQGQGRGGDRGGQQPPGRGQFEGGSNRGQQTQRGQRSSTFNRESGETISRKIGLIQNTPAAFEGYTLFAPKHFNIIYLIDNAGQMVHSWASDYEPGQSVYLLENGNLLHCCFTKSGANIGGGEGGRLEEFDWEGNLVWEYWCSDNQKSMHHDVEPMPNGNILAMIVERKAYEECIEAGFSPQSLRNGYLLPEYIVELKRKGKADAEIVWEWHVWDHLIQDNDRTKDNYGDVSAHPELISVEVNGGRGAQAFWNHMNSIDYNPDLDQIMLSVRGCSELWVIDHSTTTKEAASHSGGRWEKGGDLLYRWGNPQAYGAGGYKDQQLFQQHDAQWIKPGLPGAGDILVFNNGLNRRFGMPGATLSRGQGGYSSVDQIVPPMDEKGNYILKAGDAFGPEKPCWTYVADNPTDMYAEAISGVERLPNGNTLICDGTSGVFLEVSPSGRKVWEYVCPVAGNGPLKQGDPIPIDHRGHAMNAVFKIERYAPDYPGLVGKDLSAKGRVTGSIPEHVPENLSRRAPGGGQRRPGGGFGPAGGGGPRGRR